MSNATAIKPLTEREKEVLVLLGEGLTSKQIALKLKISPKTVHAHRNNITSKTRSRNIVEVVKYAIREGFAKV